LELATELLQAITGFLFLSVQRLFRALGPVLGRAGRGERKRERKRGREDAKNGTDVRSPSVLIFASRLFVSAANVSTGFCLDGLIGERILVLGRLTEDRSSSVQLLFSVDGGPLTDNVVLSSDQRDLYFQRTAGLIELVSPYFRFLTKS
jgi:hypothetical protein